MTQTLLPPLNKAIIMLDFDGTLIEFAPTPDAVHVAPQLVEMLEALGRISAGVTLVSGRSVQDLCGLVPGFTGDVYGSHGSEYKVNGQVGSAVDLPKNAIETIVEGAAKIAAQAPAAVLVERKPAGVVVHYRRAPELEDDVVSQMKDLADSAPMFELHLSKMAAELRPRGHSKGDAAKAIIATAQPGFHPVFAGDDATDEDAMAVVNAARGVSIKVGAGATCAQARVPDVPAMHALLSQWIKAA